MFRRLFTKSVLWLLGSGLFLVAASTPPAMSLTVYPPSTTVTTTVSLQGASADTPGQSGTPSSYHGGNHTVCAQTGLSGGVSARLAGGNLTISYTGHSTGGGVSAILHDWNVYKNCVTTVANQTPNIHCFNIHDVHASSVTSCSFTLAAKPIPWGNHTNGSPNTTGTNYAVPQMVSSCAASLQNPNISISRPRIASMTYYPTSQWLMNLPVEYTYTDAPAPQPTLTGSTSTQCNTGTLSQQPISLNEPGLAKAHQYAYAYSYADGSAKLSVTGFRVTGVSRGPAYVEMVLANNHNQLVASLPACQHPQPLLSPGSLPPHSTGDLTAYSSLYQSKGICYVTPSTAVSPSFQSVAINKQQIVFELSQDWTFSVSYQITGTITQSYWGYTTVYNSKTGQLVRTANSYNNSVSTPYSSGTITGSASVQSVGYYSPPITLNYVTGRECSLVNNVLTCPQAP